MLGGNRVILYPLYHPAAALYTPRMLEVLETDFRRHPGAARPRARARARAGAGVRAAAPRRRCSSVCSSAVALLFVAWRRRRRRSPEETEALAARLAEELRPGDVVTVSGELGSGQDDVRPRRVPVARRDRAGDEPDLHDRPPLRRRRHGVAPRPVPVRRALARGVGRPRAVLRRRCRLRRVARGGSRRAARAARPCPHATQRPRPRRSITIDRADTRV